MIGGERRYAVVSIHATAEESALEVERIVKLAALELTDRNPGLLLWSVLRKTLVTDDTSRTGRTAVDTPP